MLMNILITGASGFVGRRLVERLRPTCPGLAAAVRQSPAPGETAVGDIHADTDWSSVLCGRQCVIHTAARVHVMRDETTGMELVIIRPPLVYGPGVKGNFASMIKLVAKGLPLPLGAVHNQRSLVALDNLVDLIITCIDHPAAANQVFLAGDGQDLSTTELLRGVAEDHIIEFKTETPTASGSAQLLYTSN